MRSKRGLAAAGGPDQHDELAVGDIEVDAVQHLRRAVALDEMLDAQRRHVSAPSITSSTKRIVSRGEPGVDRDHGAGDAGGGVEARNSTASRDLFGRHQAPERIMRQHPARAGRASSAKR